jgi:hypothetical protein
MSASDIIGVVVKDEEIMKVRFFFSCSSKEKCSGFEMTYGIPDPVTNPANPV